MVLRRGLRLESPRPAGLVPFARQFSSRDGPSRSIEIAPKLRDAQDAASMKNEGERLKVNATAKTVSTAVGTLPISPLMDPTFHEARARFSQPKAAERSTAKKQKWRRALERNPYAQALATPVRFSASPKVWLPRFFLQDFGILRNPETGVPWLVPLSLASKQAYPTKGPCSVASTGVPRMGEQSPNQNSQISPLGSRSYVLARQDLIRSFLQRESKYYSKNKRIFTRRQSSTQIKAVAAQATWRPDMDTFVLELMRRRIVDQLLDYARLVEDENRSYIVKCDSYDDVKALDHRGCLLWVGTGNTGLAQVPNHSSRGPPDAPPRLSTMQIDGPKFSTRLVVHNLEVLLGEDHVKRLREGSRLLRQGSLYLLGRKRTVELQSKLWKLQGYMA